MFKNTKIFDIIEKYKKLSKDIKESIDILEDEIKDIIDRKKLIDKNLYDKLLNNLLIDETIKIVSNINIAGYTILNSLLRKLNTNCIYFNWYLSILEPYVKDINIIIEGLKNNFNGICGLFNERDIISVWSFIELEELNKEIIDFINKLDDKYKLEINLTENLRYDVNRNYLEIIIKRLHPDERKFIYYLSEKHNLSIMDKCINYNISFLYLEPLQDVIPEILDYKFILFLPLFIKIIFVSKGKFSVSEKFHTVFITEDYNNKIIEKAFGEYCKLITDAKRMKDDMVKYEDLYKSYLFVKKIIDDNKDSIDSKILIQTIKRSQYLVYQYLPKFDGYESNSSAYIILYSKMLTGLMKIDFDFAINCLNFYLASVALKYFNIEEFKFNLLPLNKDTKKIPLSYLKDKLIPTQNPFFNNNYKSIELMKDNPNVDKEIIDKLNKEVDIEEGKKHILDQFNNYIERNNMWSIFDIIILLFKLVN